MDGRTPAISDAIYVNNEAEARQVVAKIKQESADFVKVYQGLSREAYFAIADEAKKQRIPFAGHIPTAITAMEASGAGQKSVEHTYWLLLSCSSREAELRKGRNGKFSDDDLFAAELKSLDSFDEQKAHRLFALLVKNGTWLVPTLTELRGFTLMAEETKNDGARYTEEQIADLKKGYLKKLELVGLMSRAGVGILAGTDTPLFLQQELPSATLDASAGSAFLIMRAIFPSIRSSTPAPRQLVVRVRHEVA